MQTKPFLKWPGNKYSAREVILAQLKPGQRYVEPFVGAGGVYSVVDYPSYWINDLSVDLIQVYKNLLSYGSLYIGACEYQFHKDLNNDKAYYRKREIFNNLSWDNIHKSVLFVYLNRHGFNGLCRYNKKGEFNVPFGKYDKPYFPREELIHWRWKLSKSLVTNLDFEEVLRECGEGDVVYCDPPYYPISSTASFSGYLYGWSHKRDHKRLLQAAQEASNRGAYVIISNSNTEHIQSLYSGSGRILEHSTQQNIAAAGNKRGKREELILVI